MSGLQDAVRRGASAVFGGERNDVAARLDGLGEAVLFARSMPRRRANAAAARRFPSA